MKVITVLLCLSLASLTLCAEEKTEYGAAAHKASHFKDGIHNPVFDYEALIGSRDMEDLKDLEPEVRSRRLSALAKSHDANGNGVIEANELREWILQSFRMLDAEESRERMVEDDENEDGKVSFGEILSKQYGYSEDELEKMLEAEQDEDETDVMELVADDRKRFLAADLNKDGQLDESEYVAYYQPYDYPHMHQIEMDRAMKDLDKNQDGFVSAQEFIGEQADEEQRLAELTNFEELDKDKDGKLTSDELRPWALPDNNEIADEEVDHLINIVDTNKDGSLSIEEIVAKEEEFISSSATDYGRNLHFVKDEL